jgi:hypothetical protein
MKNEDFLKSELLKALDLKLKDSGFKMNKTSGEFTKKNKDGWFKYQIVFLKISGGWELKPSLLLRFDIVENIFHRISGFEEKYKKGTPTIGTSIEDYQSGGNGIYRFQLMEESQIDVIVQNLFLLFQEVALPFSERFNTLEKIDRALNIDLKDTSLTGGIYKGSKSLIIAKLVGRGNYKELEDFYLNYYKVFANGFYLPEYKRLTELL